MPINMYVNNSMQDYYNNGYETGYTWLTRGWNFVHPSHQGYPKGYVPGGPVAYTDHHRNGRTCWLSGWIEGINQYVSDNKLNYPEVINDYKSWADRLLEV